jgi:hypothetical protein
MARYWFDYTDTNGNYKIGLCWTRTKAHRMARWYGGRYQGRWKIKGGR